jgi:hypothetical protein
MVEPVSGLDTYIILYRRKESKSIYISFFCMWYDVSKILRTIKIKAAKDSMRYSTDRYIGEPSHGVHCGNFKEKK